MAELGSIKVASVNVSSRELFAAVAMHALVVSDGPPVQVEDLASVAAELADLMIEKLGESDE